MKVKILSSSEVASADFIAQWDRLANECAEANIFYSSALCLPALNNLSEFQNILFFTLWDTLDLSAKDKDGENKEERLSALFPFSKMTKYSRWPLPHYQNAQHPNSFLGNPLIWHGYEDIFWNEFLDYCNAEIGHFNFLNLDKLSLNGPIFDALQTICHTRNQRFDIIQRCERAKLETSKSIDEYYAQNIRKKKRKEIQRLRNRLDELGEITFQESLAHDNPDDEINKWLDDFLSLEHAGWKGQNGSSLASHADTKAFYWDAMKATKTNKQLHLSCMRLNGKALAMLITFINNNTGFSFKTAFDEEYARYSPGVLLQLENLTLQEKHGLKFIDSCAAENHPMIDKIWSERRTIGSISIALSGPINALYFKLIRFAEKQLDNQNIDVDPKNNMPNNSAERQLP